MSDETAGLFLRYRDEGDAEALAAVFDRTAPALLRLAMHLAQDAATAEDLVQSTFVTAMENARRFKPDRPLLPWLIGILLKKVKNQLRKRGAGPIVCDRAADRSAGPLAQAEDAELREMLANALADLPPLYRRPVSAYLEQGKRGREIALELGRAPGTVRMQIHRGLALLRRLLPPGFGLGTALLATETRGLAAMRRAVLARGAELSSESAVAATVVLGGLVMKKSILFAAALFVSGVCGLWWGLDDGRGRETAEVVRGTPSGPSGPDVPKPVQPAHPVREAAGAASVGWLRPVAGTHPEGNVVITGRILSEESPRPVAGARVALLSHDGQEHVQRSVTTGEDGRFRLERVGFKNWPTLRVSAEGFAEWRRSCHTLLTQSRERLEEFSAGDVLLDRGERVEGRVVDSRGGPVGEAWILVVTRDTSNLFRPACGTIAGRSDAAGRFVVPHLPAGDSSASRRCALFAVSEEGIGARDVRIVRGMGVLRDVVLQLAPSCRVRVRVTDERGAPVAGATVSAEPRFAPLFGVVAETDSQGLIHMPGPNHDLDLGDHEPLLRLFRTASGEDGVAEFARLPLESGRAEAGPYDLVIRAEGYRPAYLDGQIFRPETMVELAASLQTARARSIIGTVLSAAGTPVGDREVRLARALPNHLRGEEYPSTRTDARGRFRFDGLVAGFTYTVRTGTYGVDQAFASVDFEERQEVAEIELRPVTCHPITGHLLDQFGDPVPFVLLRVLTGATGRGFVGSLTEFDGSFTIPTAIPGEQELAADLWPPDLWVDLDPRWTISGDSSNVVLTAERRPPAGRYAIDVDVVDAVDGSALVPLSAGASREPHEAGAPVARASIARGSVRIEQLVPGRWTLRAEVESRGEHTLEFMVNPGDARRRLRLEVPRTGEVAGRVIFRGPASTAELRVRPKGRVHFRPLGPDGERLEGSAWGAPVGHDGRFRIGDLPPGRVTLAVHAGCVKGEVTADVVPERVTEVELACLFGGRLMTDGFSKLAAGSGALFLAGPDGVFELEKRRARDVHDRYELDAIVPPGPGAWRLTFLEGESALAPEAWPIVAEGSYDVRAGETIRLRVAGSR